MINHIHKLLLRKEFNTFLFYVVLLNKLSNSKCILFFLLYNLTWLFDLPLINSLEAKQFKYINFLFHYQKLLVGQVIKNLDTITLRWKHKNLHFKHYEYDFFLIWNIVFCLMYTFTVLWFIFEYQYWWKK